MNARWFLKRTLKWGVEIAMAASGIGFVYRNTEVFRTGQRILTYHRVLKRATDSHSISIEHFRQHMAFLADHYPIVSTEQMVGGLTGDSPAVHQAVAVTFDDGYSEAATTVAEILGRYSIPATFFVLTGVLDTQGRSNEKSYLDWQGVMDLHRGGFSIGSHATNHVSLGNLDGSTVEHELANSFQRIAAEIGVAPAGLAYPYGTMRDFSPETGRIAKKVGYRFAATAIHGVNGPRCDPYALRRTSITAGDGLRTLRMIMKGNLDPWVLVDRWGYRLQRTGAD